MGNKILLKNIFFILTWIFGFILLLNITSCRKDFSPSWEADFLIPLVNTTMGIDDILTDSILYVNPDNSISLLYRNNIYSFAADSIFSFPDTITGNVYSLPLTVTVPPGQTLINLQEVKKLNFGSANIFITDIKSGFVNFKIVNDLKEGVICNYKIPSALKNGNIFEINEFIPPASTSTNIFEKKIDISGFHIDFRGPNFLNSNRISTSFTATINPNGNPVQITPQDSLKIYVTFDNLQFNYVKGYFGQTSHSFGPDTTSINLFTKIINGNFSVEKVKAILTVENSIGVDASVIFNHLTAINSHTNQSINLVSPLIGKSVNITRAVETGLIDSPVKPSVYNYDLSTGNIISLIENMPDYISYSAKLEANPLGNVSSGNDFVYYKNGLKSYLNFEIPLSLIANNLTIVDTFDVNFSNDIRNISKGVIYLDVENFFPFSANVELSFLNKNENLNDNFYCSGTILPAELNASYIVITPVKSYIKIDIPPEKTEILKNSKRLIIKAKFNTASQTHHIKLFNDYKLNIKISANFKYTVNTEEF